MNFDFSTIDELLKKAKDEKLYEKLLLQLQMDFGLANIQIDIVSSVLPEVLKNILHEKVYVLLMERFSEYLNLLYIVDVPEKAFKEIDVTDVVEVAEQVSFLILKREMQKVRLKSNYS